MFQTGTYQVTTGPASEPFTTSEVKNYLKVDSSTDDTFIDSLIQAARESAEKYAQLALISQTVTEKFDCLHAYGLRLSVSPLISVTSISYLDSGGNSQTLSTDYYDTDTYLRPPLIFRKYGATFPTTYAQRNAVTVVYTAGYASTSAIPWPIKTAMLLMIGEWYNNRQDSVRNMPTAAMFFLDQYRIDYYK